MSDIVTRIFPGARVVHNIQPTTKSAPILAIARGKTRRQVTTCTKCALVDGCSGPVPYRGPSDAKFVIVGEAPGRDEDAQGKPFVGATGKVLRRMLGAAGFHPDDDVLYANVNSCWPKGKDGKTRAPNEDEMRACRENLMAQIQLVNSPYVMLLGATALKAFRTDLQVSKDRGVCFIWDNARVTMTTYHPAAGLRGQPEILRQIEKDLRAWRVVIEGHGNWEWIEHLSQVCTKCRGEAERYDEDAVGWCERHWKQWGEKAREKQRKKWLSKVAGQQTTVFDFTGTMPV